MSAKPEEQQVPGRAAVEAAIREELHERDLRIIRALLKKPMSERTHFLRKRLPNGGSCL
jgi:hypothetical protein